MQVVIGIMCPAATPGLVSEEGERKPLLALRFVLAISGRCENEQALTLCIAVLIGQNLILPYNWFEYRANF